MNSSKSARYELLDPLRGLAILAVMTLHICERGRVSGDTLIFDPVWSVAQHGYLGVQLFFVISGYCIAAALYGAMYKPRPFRYFVSRRLRRIFPPYWASIVLIVALGVATVVVLKTPASVVFDLTPFDWICNILLIQGPLQATDANLVYWSLCIELQFYTVMAFALFWSRWTEVWLIAISILCVTLGYLMEPLWGTVVVYWPEFVCGIAAYYWITGAMRWKGTPWLLAGLVLLDVGLQSTEYSVWVQGNGRFIQPVKLVFCLTCMIAMLALRPLDQKLTKLRGVKAFAFFGLISYSLYLTHVPITTRIFNLTDRVVGLDGLKWLACALAAMVISTIFGWLFFRWFEKPWLNPAVSRATVESAKTLTL